MILRFPNTRTVGGNGINKYGANLLKRLGQTAKVIPSIYQFGKTLLATGNDEYGAFTPFANGIDISISFWFKMHEFEEGSNYLFLASSSEIEDYIGVRNTGAGSSKIFIRAGSNKDVTTNEKLELNTWYHLAIIHNNSTEKTIIRLDGVDLSADGITGAFDLSNIDQLFRAAGTYSQFIGQLDDIVVWNNKLLTEQDCLNIEAGKSPLKVAGGPNRWYKLNNNALDSGSDGEDITLNGFSDTYFVDRDFVPEVVEPEFSFGQGLQFNGVDNFLSGDAILAANLTKLTISVFIIRENGKWLRFGFGDATDGILVSWRNNNNRIDVHQYYNGSTDAHNSATNILSNNQIAHLLISLDSNRESEKALICLNGVKVAVGNDGLSEAKLTRTEMGFRFYNAEQAATFGECIIDKLVIDEGYAATEEEALAIWNEGNGANYNEVTERTANHSYDFEEELTSASASDGGAEPVDLDLNNFSSPPDYRVNFVNP